jgi:hypothetical protein
MLALLLAAPVLLMPGCEEADPCAGLTRCQAEGMLPLAKLSDYDFFVGPLVDLKPKQGVVPYQVAAPLWSDQAGKHRFIVLPEGGKIGFKADDSEWEFPEGTILVKNFFFDHDRRDVNAGSRIIETRLLLRTADNWRVFTYVWNDEQTEATPLRTGKRVDIDFIDVDGSEKTEEYIVPNDDQCASCHERDDVQHSLGLITPQMNRMVERDGKMVQQLEWLAAQDLFVADPPAPASLTAFVDPFGSEGHAGVARARVSARQLRALPSAGRRRGQERAGVSGQRAEPRQARGVQGAGGGGPGDRRLPARHRAGQAGGEHRHLSHELAGPGDQDAGAAEPGDRQGRRAADQRLDRGDAGRRRVRRAALSYCLPGRERVAAQARVHHRRDGLGGVGRALARDRQLGAAPAAQLALVELGGVSIGADDELGEAGAVAEDVGGERLALIVGPAAAAAGRGAVGVGRAAGDDLKHGLLEPEAARALDGVGDVGGGGEAAVVAREGAGEQAAVDRAAQGRRVEREGGVGVEAALAVRAGGLDRVVGDEQARGGLRALLEGGEQGLLLGEAGVGGGQQWAALGGRAEPGGGVEEDEVDEGVGTGGLDGAHAIAAIRDDPGGAALVHADDVVGGGEAPGSWSGPRLQVHGRGAAAPLVGAEDGEAGAAGGLVRAGDADQLADAGAGEGDGGVAVVAEDVAEPQQDHGHAGAAAGGEGAPQLGGGVAGDASGEADLAEEDEAELGGGGRGCGAIPGLAALGGAGHEGGEQ